MSGNGIFNRPMGVIQTWRARSHFKYVAPTIITLLSVTSILDAM